jgi:hypothetical protein
VPMLLLEGRTFSAWRLVESAESGELYELRSLLRRYVSLCAFFALGLALFPMPYSLYVRIVPNPFHDPAAGQTSEQSSAMLKRLQLLLGIFGDNHVFSLLSPGMLWSILCIAWLSIAWLLYKTNLSIVVAETHPFCQSK